AGRAGGERGRAGRCGHRPRCHPCRRQGHHSRKIRSGPGLVCHRGRALPAPGAGRVEVLHMSELSMEVNGRKVSGDVPARTHLGDFLREKVRLTGTNLSCEHGVCGACTVLVDGKPVRSCITFAAACEGKQVTTIEGYDNDPIMRRLREAFHDKHALQCGFCTPGMLATSRDIVLRLPDADERRVRIELSGNICRCTGYQGITAAVMSVLQALREQPDAEVEALRRAAAQGKAALPEPAKAEEFAGFQAVRRPGANPAAAAAAAATESTAAASSAAADKAGKGS